MERLTIEKGRAADIAFAAAAVAFGQARGEEEDYIDPRLCLVVNADLAVSLADELAEAKEPGEERGVLAPIYERLFGFALPGGGHNAEVLWRQASTWQGVRPHQWPAAPERTRQAFLAFSAFVRGIRDQIAPDAVPEPEPSGAGSAGRTQRRIMQKPKGLKARTGGMRLGRPVEEPDKAAKKSAKTPAKKKTSKKPPAGAPAK